MPKKQRKYKESDFQKWTSLKMSDYGKQLKEKQKARYTYGVLEKQFRRYYIMASKSKTSRGETLLQLLERRLDNVLYRLGYGISRPHARQLIVHKKIQVNDKKINIPSFLVTINDRIEPVHKQDFQLYAAETPKWLALDKKKKTAKVVALPTREELPANINEQLIIEYYSR